MVGAELLESNGASVTTANNGQEALEALERTDDKANDFNIINAAMEPFCSTTVTSITYLPSKNPIPSLNTLEQQERKQRRQRRQPRQR